MAKRKISLKAIAGAIKSKKTPKHLKEGLIRKYGHLLKNEIPASILKWRSKQPHGSIMKPSTFKKIKQSARRKGYKDPQAVAGKAYWSAVKSKYKRANAKRKRKMLPNIPVEIYDKVLRIEAQKGSNSKYPHEKFYHNFKGKTKAKIFGLADGSLLIKGAKRLWDSIPQ